MTRSVADSLTAFIDHVRARVDEALERSLPAPPACPPLVSEAMRYSVFAGGKRLRPVLALAAADAVSRASAAAPNAPGGPALPPFPDVALPVACALELIHTYSLIHDDLPAMDNDTLRRGRPTLHVVYGDGIAILAGDGLQAEAFSLVAREPATDDPEISARKIRALAAIAAAAGVTGMVGGQAIDLQAAGQAPGHALTLDADGLRAMHARKTGALITASATSGAIMAGATARQLAAIDRYGALVGLAFQIVDDVLDVEGDARTLGKSAGKDAKDAKPTYPALFGLKRSREMAADCAADAKASIEREDLTDGWLAAVADWIVGRRN
jgi:geranylgeranyl diphosphate synthase type II